MFLKGLINSWVFADELRGSGIDSGCSYLNFRYCSSFKQWSYITWLEHTIKIFLDGPHCFIKLLKINSISVHLIIKKFSVF